MLASLLRQIFHGLDHCHEKHVSRSLRELAGSRTFRAALQESIHRKYMVHALVISFRQLKGLRYLVAAEKPKGAFISYSLQSSMYMNLHWHHCINGHGNLGRYDVEGYWMNGKSYQENYHTQRLRHWGLWFTKGMPSTAHGPISSSTPISGTATHPHSPSCTAVKSA